jgi:hypothetical protein
LLSCISCLAPRRRETRSARCVLGFRRARLKSAFSGFVSGSGWPAARGASAEGARDDFIARGNHQHYWIKRVGATDEEDGTRDV